MKTTPMNPITVYRLWPLAAAALLLASLSGRTLAADDSAQLALGKKLFLQGAAPPCALCHTLQAAGAEGAVGPVLDELKPDATPVAKALRNGLGQMPSYSGRLSDEQINALSLFVAKASGGAM